MRKKKQEKLRKINEKFTQNQREINNSVRNNITT